jgi:thiol-disulfide isomerase/thioredoxin
MEFHMFTHVASRTNRRGLLISLVAGGALALANVAAAQDATTQPPAPTPQQAPAEIVQAEVAPEAKAVLDRVAAFYKQLPGVKVTAKMSVKVPGEEGVAGQETDITMAAADPNKFVVPLETGGQYDQFKIVSTGEKVVVFYGAPINKYQEKEAPKSYEGVVDAMSMGEKPDIRSLGTPMFPVLALMEGKSLAEVSGVSKVEFVGDEDLEGQPVSHIRMLGAEMDVDVWALKGEEPWVIRVRPDPSKSLKELGEMGESLKASMPEVTLNLTKWERTAEFPETTFAFTPPEGAEKVDSLMEAMRAQMGGGEQGPAEDAHAQLLGKPAPAINLDLLGGGKASLDSAKGKVVMLDFWATWCPPCVRGLPVVSGIAEKYKDKGLVFYAVNEQEDEETIKAFLEKKSLKIPVALDKDGSLGNRYLVTGIPQTVLIGKDGTVQVVHVGFMPSMEEELTKQIEDLLAGKNLAAEAQKEKPSGEPTPQRSE